MMGTLTNFVSGGLAGAVVTLLTQKVSEALRIWGLSKKPHSDNGGSDGRISRTRMQSRQALY